jgi:hypothetical protein
VVAVAPAVRTAKSASKPAARAPAAAPRRAPSPPHDAQPSSRGSAGILGGVVLVGVVMLLLGGLAYLLWTNVWADRLSRTEGSGGESVIVAKGPAVSPDPDKDRAPVNNGKAPPEKSTTKDGTRPQSKDGGVAKKDDEVDVADLKKKEPPEPMPVVPAPVKSNDPDKPPKKAPTIEVTTTPEPQASGYEAARVNAAVDKGVRFLKSMQKPDGSWDYVHSVGFTALAALTLLECQVPAKDPAIQGAAHYIRKNLATLRKTYDLSCAILFLDRLNEPTDRVLIQGLALRVVSGQTDSGGWNYECHALGVADLRALQAFLESHRPVPPAPRKDNKPRGDITDNPVPPQAALLQPVGGVAGPPVGITMPDIMAVPLPGGKPPVPNPITSPYRPDGKAEAPNGGVEPKGKKVQPIAPNMLPPHLQSLPVVQLNMNKGWFTATHGGGDHSNTQFALLALWAARRYDVPTEYSLLLSYQRFKLLQAANGGWGYKVGQGTTNTMICAGLLALTMGHGAVPNLESKDKVEDQTIRTGLQALGSFIGTAPTNTNAKTTLPNLYFLWSVERVAVLYDLKTIGGSDWYSWGAQTLLVNQAGDGSWSCNGQYTGSQPMIDTCFALLFLKRSNLVGDLTENIRLFMVIRDPGAR